VHKCTPFRCGDNGLGAVAALLRWFILGGDNWITAKISLSWLGTRGTWENNRARKSGIIVGPSFRQFFEARGISEVFGKINWNRGWCIMRYPADSVQTELLVKTIRSNTFVQILYRLLCKFFIFLAIQTKQKTIFFFYFWPLGSWNAVPSWSSL
jgi:hypothetical protein